MSIELLNATSASNSAFRVVCGTMPHVEKTISHHEALFGHVKNGTVTLETAGGATQLNKDDIYFISPNTRYKLTKSDAEIDVITINFTNPAAVTQDYVPQSVIRALINNNCTSYAKIATGDHAHSRILNCFTVASKAETDKPEYFQLLV